MSRSHTTHFTLLLATVWTLSAAASGENHAPQPATTQQPLQLTELHQIIEQSDLQRLNQLSNNHPVTPWINQRGMFGRTAIYLTESPEMLRWLLEHGADPLVTNDFGDPPLLHHVQKNREELVKIMLEFGANPRQMNAFGNTPLREAIWKRDKTLYLLLKQATELEKPNGAEKALKDTN